MTAAAVRQPARPEDLSSAEDLFRNPWPDELVQWFATHDGIDESPFTGNGPLPGWVPCSLAQALEAAGDMTSDASDLFGREMVADGERRRAGTQSPCWLPSFVPLAVGVAADYLIVDTRPGPRHGVLREWNGEDGTGAGPRPSLTTLLADTASCLEAGRSFRGLIPEIVEGGLHWQDVDHPARALPPDGLPPAWQDFYRQFRDYRVAVWNDDGNTWDPDLNEQQAEVEQLAQSSRYEMMDVFHSVLEQDRDVWNGHHTGVLEHEWVKLRRLAPQLTSDLSRQRTIELLELGNQLQVLMKDHPLPP